jgi:hypothetical protein
LIRLICRPHASAFILDRGTAMSEMNVSTRDDDDVPIESDAIQFDQAEYATTVPSGPTCGACQRAIVDEYYEINGKVVCAPCRRSIEASFHGGSGLARALKALFFGSAAALVGALLYYAFVRLTNINFGLVAVVLGLMVGGAVRKGSGNRGGRFYQLLAVFLAYSAIVGMHVPSVIAEITQLVAEKEPSAAALTTTEKPADVRAPRTKSDGVVNNPPNYTGADIPANPFADAPASEPKASPKPVQTVQAPHEAPEPAITPFAFAISVAVLIGICYAYPVLASIQAPISGLIYGFALWEAWKITKGVNLSLNGPYRVNATVSGLEPEVDGDNG